MSELNFFWKSLLASILIHVALLFPLKLVIEQNTPSAQAVTTARIDAPLRIKLLPFAASYVALQFEKAAYEIPPTLKANSIQQIAQLSQSQNLKANEGETSLIEPPSIAPWVIVTPDQEAVPLNKPPLPMFWGSESPRRALLQLSIIISHEGDVTGVIILTQETSESDTAAAIAALKLVKFKPAMRNGMNVPSRKTIELIANPALVF